MKHIQQTLKFVSKLGYINVAATSIGGAVINLFGYVTVHRNVVRVTGTDDKILAVYSLPCIKVVELLVDVNTQAPTLILK